MGSSGIRKAPVSLVTPERDRLVPVFTAVTVTLGTTAPVLSVTSPAMSPVILWPRTGRLTLRQTTRTKKNARWKTSLCRIAPPSDSLGQQALLGRSLVGASGKYQGEITAQDAFGLLPVPD